MLTFPTYRGELPECLNPLNLRHYWLLSYWVFFRPTALKCYLYRADPEFYRAGPGLSIFRTLFVPVYRNLYLTALGICVLFLVLIGLLTIGVDLISSEIFGAHPLTKMMYGLAFGLTFGLVGGVVRGVFFGVIRGVFFGVVCGVTFTLAALVVIYDIEAASPGTAFGLGFGLAFSAVSGVAGCMTIDVVIVMLVGVAVISILDSAGKVAFGLAFAVGALRVIFYIFEFGLALRSTSGKGKHPVEWDELVVLPLPGTQRVLTDRLQQDELSGLRLVADVARNPFQRWAAQRTLQTYLHNQARPLHFLYALLDSLNLSTYISAPVSKKDWQKLTTTGQLLVGELGGQWVNTKTGWAEQLVERLVWSLTWFCRDQRQTPLTLFASMLHQLLDNKTVNKKSFRLSNYQKAYTGLAPYPGSEEIFRSFETLNAFLAYDNILTLPEAVELVSGLTPDEKSIRPAVLTTLVRLGAVGAEVATCQATASHVKQRSALTRGIKRLSQLNEYVVAEVATPEQKLLQGVIRQWRSLINEAVGSTALKYTFPTYRGRLPQCLSPLNLRHYFLLAYWVYFRPTALNCYLYQAAPDLYQTRGLGKILRTLSIPAYRNLYWMSLGAIALFSVLVVSLVVPDQLVTHSHEVNAVAVIPGRRAAISASSDGTVKMWNLEHKPPLSILLSNISFYGTSKEPDNKRWQEQLTWQSGSQGVTAVAVTPNRQHVVSGLTDRTRFDYLDLGGIIPYLENTFQVRIFNRNLDRRNTIGTGTLKVWNLENGEEIFLLKGHTKPVNAVAITPDGQQVVSAADDDTLKVWNLKSGKELLTLRGHTKPVKAVAITPDGQQAVSAADDDTLKVWNLKSGKELRTLRGHTKPVKAVAITPDGQQAVSASDDYTLKVWNLKSGKELRTLRGHRDRVRVIALTSDGKRAISFAVTGSFPRIWDLEKGVELQRANDLLVWLPLPVQEYGLKGMMVISGVLSVALILAVSVVTFGVVGTLIGGIINLIVLRYAFSPVQNIVLTPLVGVVPKLLYIVVSIVFYVDFMPLGMAGGVASRKAFGVVGSGVIFAVLMVILCGVFADVVPEKNLSLVNIVVVNLIGSVVVGLVGGAWFGMVSIASASRLILHPVYWVLSLRSRFGKGRHPVEWDELIVLPLPGIQRILTQRLQQNERNGLRLVAEVAGNPFQRACAQQALHTHLHQKVAPLRFLYALLTNPDWQTYVYAPVNKQDWDRLPTTGQLLLGELGGQWVDCSSGRFNRWAERRVWKLTRFLRNQCQTPLTRFAIILYQLLDEKTVEAEEFDLSSYRNAYADLTLYPDGEEITRSFKTLATFLAYNQVSDLAKAVDVVSRLVPADTAVRPAVLTALAGLGAVGAEVATYQAATSRVNQLAALARAAKSLDDLDEYIVAEVVTPEKALLRRVVRQWRPLITEASGRVGRAEVSSPIANPYVVGSPVTNHSFVGREDIMRRLEELWMVRGQCPSVVIYGHRRMGKSSILRNLRARLGSQTIIVDFNMQRVGLVDSTRELLYNFALSIYDAVPVAQQDQLGEPDEERFISHNPYTALDRFLKQLSSVRGEQRFIITIDEFELIEQLIEEKRLEPRLLDFWRGLIQTYPWFVLAFAGLHTLQEMTQNYWNPLFGSVTAISVSFLSPKAAERLISQPSSDFDLDYDAEAIAEIIQLTNGQPYLVQLVGHTLVTCFNRQMFEEGIERDRRFTLADVQAVINTPEFYRDGNAYFNGVWVQAENSEPAGQTAILEALCQAGLSITEIAETTSLSCDRIQSALETLQRHDVIKQQNGQYVYTVELMRRWVAQQTNVQQ